MNLSLPPIAPLKATLGLIPGGEAGTRATLARMLQLVYDARTSKAVRDAAAQIVARVPQHDLEGEAQAIFDFVRDRIRYARDPVWYEMLQSPEQVLLRRQGDCDDKSILLMSLLGQLGIPSVFVVGGVDPGRYVHVWVEARVNGAISMDATENHPMGWTPPLPYTMQAGFES